MSRLCEEFHCLPSAAWREWRRLPAGMLERILSVRAYARMKATYDARGRGTVDPPLLLTVREIDFQLVQEARDARARELEAAPR